MEHILADAETAGLLRSMSGGKWVDMTGTPASTSGEQAEQPDEGDNGEIGAVESSTSTEGEGIPTPVPSEVETLAARKRPNAIFVGHGKNKKPRDQLVKILTEYGIPHKVAEDEPNKGRPIPTKVKDTMEECGAAILIFSADEELFDKDGQALWRPSENVVHELGAASVMYDNRIVVFREESVHLATNYDSIGYITFEKDDIPAKANVLFRELIAFGILKVSVNAD
jgi:predicted nucleotide-binding protein